MTILKTALVVAYMVWAGHGRRLQFSAEREAEAETAEDHDESPFEPDTVEQEVDEEAKRQKIQEENESQIKQVRANIDVRTLAVEDLAAAASDLSQSEIPSEMSLLQESLASVEKTLKEAYVLEAKNTKDKRVLDKLADLSDEHMPVKKEALADIAALAEKASSAKRMLTKVKGKVENKKRIKQVRQNIEDRTAAIDELTKAAEELNLGEFPVDETEMAQLQKVLVAVQKTHKEASELEKYIGRDRRALSKKSGLTSEELNARKQMIKDIDVSAGTVEVAKDSLASFQRKLKAKIQVKQVQANVQNLTAEIDALERRVSDISESELQVGTTGMDRIEEAIAAMEQAQKEAERFEKISLQDKARLNELSDLPDDDSPICEDTILGVEAFLERLEGARTSLLEFLQQLKGKKQIKRIMQNIDKRTVEIDELLETTSTLSNDGIPAEIARIEEALVAVQKAEKDALYLGEFIVKDMIAVDKLLSLSDEDRPARKQAILDMNELGNRVDSAKSILADHHRQLDSERKNASIN